MRSSTALGALAIGVLAGGISLASATAAMAGAGSSHQARSGPALTAVSKLAHAPAARGPVNATVLPAPRASRSDTAPAPLAVPKAGRVAASVAKVYHTTATGVHVRAKATTASTSVATLGAAGSSVTVGCWAPGQSVVGDTVWYATFGPARGYVSGYYLDTGRDPATGIPRCTTSFKTTVTGLHVRTQPTSDSSTVKVLGAAGSPVTLSCWVSGQTVQGDAIWYRLAKPAVGYAAAYYVNTGRDPAAGIAHCG